MKKLLLCISGATASGKSELVLQLCQYYPLQIISVDSAQIYRGMDIGTAKPSAAICRLYPHDLIDIIEPEENYSAIQFSIAAQQLIAKAQRNGKIPVLVGGTMLYLHTLLQGKTPLPKADVKLRTQLEQRMQQQGITQLYDELCQRDYAVAKNIAANDRQRIIRALELMAISGKKVSELYAAQTQQIHDWSLLTLILNPPRDLLHQRIAARFEQMIAAGFIDEVQQLRQRPQLTATHTAMRSVGYRQLWSYLEGDCSKAQAIENGIIATRQLAKRQLTWLRNRLAPYLQATTIDPLQNDSLQLLRDLIEKRLHE